MAVDTDLGLAALPGTRISYSVIGREDLKEFVQLSKNDLLDIEETIGGYFLPLASSFLDISIPDVKKKGGETSDGDPYILELDVGALPQYFLEYDKDEEEVVFKPFLPAESGTAVRVKFDTSENVAVLPVQTRAASAEAGEGFAPAPPIPQEELDLLEEGSDAPGKALLTSSSAKPFFIVSNSERFVKVYMNKASLGDPYWWNLYYTVDYRKLNASNWTSASVVGSYASFTASSNGTYTVKVTGHWQLGGYYWDWGSWSWKPYAIPIWYSGVLWEQDVHVESHALSEAERRTLAERHAPLVVLDKEESYTPIGMSYLFNMDTYNATLAEELFTISKSWWLHQAGDNSFAFKDSGSILPYWGHRDSWINIADAAQVKASEMRRRTDEGSAPTVFYSVEERSPSYIFIHYHFLFPIDPKGGTPDAPVDGAHVFDRESITVVLKNDYSKTPLHVIYGAHLPDMLMSYNVWTGSSVWWWAESFKLPWDAVSIEANPKSDGSIRSGAPRVGNRPLAFLAKGAHACYPYPGLYYCAGSSEYAGRAPESDVGNKVLLPPGLAGGRNYILSDLGISGLTRSSPNKYLCYSGWMVDVAGPINAKFPPFTERENDPDTYLSKSETVQWNFLSASSVTYLEQYEEYLSRYMEITQRLNPYLF